MIDCDQAAQRAADSEPCTFVVRAAEVEAQRLRALGQTLSEADVYTIARNAQHRLKLHNVKNASRQRGPLKK